MGHGQKAHGQKAHGAAAEILPAFLKDAIRCRIDGAAAELVSHFARDATLTIIGSVAGKPMVPAMTGHLELTAFYTGFFQRWDWRGMRLVRSIYDGRSAAIEISGTLVHRVSGQTFETTICDLLDIADDKITGSRCYSDTFTIVRVAGLAL